MEARDFSYMGKSFSQACHYSLQGSKIRGAETTTENGFLETVGVKSPHEPYFQPRDTFLSSLYALELQKVIS